MPLDLKAVAAVALAAYTSKQQDQWVAEQLDLGRRVAAFRRYAEGDHPANLSAEMKASLRINSDDVFDEFNDNYMDLVVQTMVDRLRVAGYKTNVAAADQWLAEWMADCRFDALQGDVHEAAVRDGDTYIMAYYDNAAGQTLISHEPAWDGRQGMLVFYESTASARPVVAIKMWRLGEITRVTIYHPDRVERYYAGEDGKLQAYRTDMQAEIAPWTDAAGRPLGLPVFHLRNRARSGMVYGVSEIRTAIPLQNALNRTLYSMVYAGEMSAFMIRLAKGFQPPAGVSPGMWLTVGFKDKDGNVGPPSTAEETAALSVVSASSLEQAELAPYLDMARWIKGEISYVTRTPAPEFAASADASGEALKQRESGLLGKVRRFQVRAGNVWEDVALAAARVQAAYGVDEPPAFERVTVRWADAEIRNDAATVQAAITLAPLVGPREALRIVAPLYDWDEARIDEILDERADEMSNQVAAAAAVLPTYQQTSDRSM